ncbi:hypothetical protein TIFTF001_048503 [Ficus carica]|uniref:Uncharacterized protein n=1 Tax=Ficus carica TaxID=3494 RepID=A0AA87YTL5_FICCA|nr:hypothetical protein TIFTF001_048493 [Ficus carica]GMN18656.1 hypothetical protein TIFTF001_048496 [Ficus carica]GMN18664.1 hypothetical protein TIFTF001_048500 [Ficus carica]GMN18668.1 hypothetical protein TIFTF001_048503 [Ficus carica]
MVSTLQFHTPEEEQREDSSDFLTLWMIPLITLVFEILSFHKASKAALISFSETLRTELGSAIGMTIVTPGLINTNMSKGKEMSDSGQYLPWRLVLDGADVVLVAVSDENGVSRGDRVVQPFVPTDR